MNNPAVASVTTRAATSRDPLAIHVAAVARALLGPPNPLLSKPGNPRWGNKGSFVVDEERGVWFDHERGIGGGVLDLIADKLQLTGREAFAWMRSIGCHIEDGGRGVAKANGSKRRSPVRPVSGKDAGKDAGKKGILETYDYNDADGTLAFQVVRFGFRKADGTFQLGKNGKPEKSFSQRRPDLDNPKSWIWGLGAGEYMRKAAGENWYRFDEPRWAKLPASRERKTIATPAKSVPYRLPEIIEAISIGNTVFIVEGEQKADILAKWNSARDVQRGRRRQVED